METVERDFIGQDELDKVFDVVIEVTLMPLPGLPMSGAETQLKRMGAILVSYGLHGLVIAGALTALARATQSAPLLSTAMAIAILLSIVGAGIWSTEIMAAVIVRRRGARSPYAPFLKHVANSFTFDMRFVNLLMLCDLNAVRYVLSYYKFERATYERRVNSLAGSIERIGIFPALAVLAVLAAHLMQAPGPGLWLLGLVPAICVLHVMKLRVLGMLEKKDRVIAMLEFVVQSRG